MDRRKIAFQLMSWQFQRRQTLDKLRDEFLIEMEVMDVEFFDIVLDLYDIPEENTPDGDEEFIEGTHYCRDAWFVAYAKAIGGRMTFDEFLDKLETGDIRTVCGDVDFAPPKA